MKPKEGSAAVPSLTPVVVRFPAPTEVTGTAVAVDTRGVVAGGTHPAPMIGVVIGEEKLKGFPPPPTPGSPPID